MLTEEEKRLIDAKRQAAIELRERKARERALLQQQQQQHQASTAAPSKNGDLLSELTRQGGFCAALKEGDIITKTEEKQKGTKETAEPHRVTAVDSTATEGNNSGGPPSEGCEMCGMLTIDQVFLKTFNVRVCLHCKVDNDDYKLMSKGDVASEFLLQDGTIGVLPFLERSNPRNAKYQAMKLYLKKQAREKSYARWGGLEELEEERERRKKRKYEAALQKTTDVMKKK